MAKIRPSASRRSIEQQSMPLHVQQRLREGLVLVSFAFCLFILLALFTYHESDPSWSHWVSDAKVENAAGKTGAWLADVLLTLLGYVGYLFPLLICFASLLYYLHHHGKQEHQLNATILYLRLLGLGLVLCSSAGLASFHIKMLTPNISFYSGGILGQVIGGMMLQAFNAMGATLLLFTIFLVGITLFTNFSWLKLSEFLGAGVLAVFDWVAEMIKSRPLLPNINRSKLFNLWPSAAEEKPIIKNKIEPKIHGEEEVIIRPRPIEISTPQIRKPKLEMITNPDPEVISREMRNAPRYSSSEIIPDLSLLDSPVARKKTQIDSDMLTQRSRELEQCLSDFGVNVKVMAIHPGPVVTRFELELAAGTKVSKISGLAKDVARSLSVVSVRVVEVIPGKSYIGVELPNVDREIVSLQEVLASKQYQNARSALTLALGKDIAGHPVIVDLAKMPHLLVAGTTGAGKSVSLNAMLLSLLYKATPKQLRLILIDPKMLELSVYDGIPHLLTPVVTDMRDAATALRWCVMEMERRYRLMAAFGVRNIAGYNVKVKEASERGAPLLDPLMKGIPGVDDQEQKALQELPQIVVLADEFADMMVVVGKKVETLIARLAQKARAAGVHLILATQRPSVDVITGLIKANIPTRIAFQVSSKIDSRTILDQAGAEQLLGHGDMLYLAPGTGVPVRVHGAYVSDEEVHRVVASLKEHGEPDYVNEILEERGSSEDSSGFSDAGFGSEDVEQDPFYDEAVYMVTKARRVSVSSIQRRFKIGYNRAARIVECMETAGIVSKMEGNGNREVLAPPPLED